MSGTIWPVDAVSGAPSFTGRMLRETMSALAGGATAARPFGGFSGVRPGTSQTIGSMSGLNYTVTPFGGLVDGESSNLAGPYEFSFPANETGTIPAQTGTARAGLLSVKVNDPAEGDAGLPSMSLVYTDSLTSPGHGFDLYKVNIPATGGGSPTLTWIGPFTAAAGGILPCLSSATYPAAASYPGLYIDDMSLGILLRSNGTSWMPVSGGSAGTVVLGSGITVPSGYATKLEKNGNIVTMAFNFSNSAVTPTASLGSGTILATLPTGFRPQGNAVIGFMGFNNSGTVNVAFTIEPNGNLRAQPQAALGGTATISGTVSFSVA